MKKRPRGRPHLPDSERKGFMLRIRMTDDERTVIEQASTREGQDISSWARRLIVSKAKKILAQENGERGN
jgi:uncharacterized protein (DUF1778 family)